MSNTTRPGGYDERFVVPLEASRRGAHRARANPLMAALPLLAVAVVVAGAIALAWTLFSGSFGSGSRQAGDPGPGTTAAPVAPAASPRAPSATDDGASVSPSPKASSPSTSAPASPSTSASAAAGAVDKTVALAVYNGTRPAVTGVGRRAASKLTAAGWAPGTATDWKGTPVSVTTVFYARPDDLATAQAVAKSLGIGKPVRSAGAAGAGMAVVVGNDWPS